MIFTECTFRKKKRGKKLCIVIAAAIILAAIAVSYTNSKLDPLVCDTAIPQIQNAINVIINEATEKILNSFSADFISVKCGDNGKIISVETDTSAINRFRTSVSLEISSRLSELSEYGVYIALSNILDDEIILGRFPDLRVRANIEPNGGAETTVSSSLTSAGINQSLHRIKLSVRVDVRALLLISTVEVSTSTDICIAETVIIGDVPAVYLSGS